MNTQTNLSFSTYSSLEVAQANAAAIAQFIAADPEFYAQLVSTGAL